MRIGVAQTFVAEEMKTNTARMMEKIAAAADMEIDLLLFPEMCLTGYNFHAWKNAHFWGELDESLQKLALQASATEWAWLPAGYFLPGTRCTTQPRFSFPMGRVTHTARTISPPPRKITSFPVPPPSPSISGGTVSA